MSDRGIIAAKGGPEKMIRRRVRLKITAASRETVRPLAPRVSGRCPACRREVGMVTEGEAAVILSVDGAALAGLVAAGSVHAVRTVSGRLWVCKESLFVT